MACPMCTGTDLAEACNRGQCFAEQEHRRWLEGKDDPSPLPEPELLEPEQVW